MIKRIGLALKLPPNFNKTAVVGTTLRKGYRTLTKAIRDQTRESNQLPTQRNMAILINTPEKDLR